MKLKIHAGEMSDLRGGALATDFNPGSSPVLSMQFIIQLACRMYKMSYEEAINAATINAAK